MFIRQSRVRKFGIAKVSRRRCEIIWRVLLFRFYFSKLRSMVRISPPPSAPPELQPRSPRKRQKSAPLPSASDLWVQSLPGLDKLRTTLFAGNLPSALPTDASDAHLYFLLARNKHIPNRQRLVIWFNGGPVSSLDRLSSQLCSTESIPSSSQGCSSEFPFQRMIRYVRWSPVSQVSTDPWSRSDRIGLIKMEQWER